MKMLMQKEYQEIRAWMHRNARPLEMAVWNYFFEGGARDEIADALAYYQNDDGGFGNGVEPGGRDGSYGGTERFYPALRKT